MEPGKLVAEARKRAGFTQADLAERVGTTQSSIARLERGGNDPSWGRVNQLIEACHLTLDVALTIPDDAELATIRRNLDLTPEQRWIRIVNGARFVLAGRSAMQARELGAND